MSKALNYSRPEELTENFFLSNGDMLTCCLSTMAKEIYTYMHAWKNDEVMFSAVSNYCSKSITWMSSPFSEITFAKFEFQLEKVYDPKNEEDDMVEMEEERLRMREHVMNEV